METYPHQKTEIRRTNCDDYSCHKCERCVTVFLTDKILYETGFETNPYYQGRIARKLELSKSRNPYGNNSRHSEKKEEWDTGYEDQMNCGDDPSPAQIKAEKDKIDEEHQKLFDRAWSEPVPDEFVEEEEPV